jgi:16S rRNA (cytosine967-C5)-methyltransferase
MGTPAEVRAQAARLVLEVSARGRSLDALFANQRGGQPQERGLMRTLAYGTLRWHFRLNAILERLLAGPPGRLAPEVRALSLVGLFQLLHTDIAPHAAVSETVNATKVLGMPRAASLVNALLRRCQREAVELAALVDADPALRTAHPSWFVEVLQRDWPEDFGTILDENNRHPPFWLRVNRLRITRDAYAERLVAVGLQARATVFAPDALLLPEAVDVKALPGFAEGWVSVQDAAAQLAAPLLDPKAGQRVLDACAAPGGKACHLLEREPDLAELVALDISAERLSRVRENLDRLNLTATLQSGDAGAPEAWWDGRPFARILLDVPCSATGVIRRHPDIKLLRRATDIPALAERQAQLLKTAWSMLEPGGRLLYASCSVLKAENATVVGAFLAAHTDARDITAQAAAWPAAPWRQPASEPGLRIRPGEAGLDGFYYACLQKSNG